jgi:hypothetical protein
LLGLQSGGVPWLSNLPTRETPQDKSYMLQVITPATARTLMAILKSSDAILITGENFKNLEREPDFYFRDENVIILFESKDFFMSGKSKLSYDFDMIEGELMKEGRLKNHALGNFF